MGMCRVCVCVRVCAGVGRVCGGARRYALGCTGVHGCAHVCAGVHMCMQVYIHVCGWVCVWVYINIRGYVGV